MAKGSKQAEDVAILVDTLFTLMPMVVGHINERLEELDMTNTDLWALRSIEGPMPMKDLAHCMNYDPSYVTVVADRLEERQLIERQPHPSDRRVKMLALTAKGERLKQTLPERIWSDTTMFSALSDAQSQQLLDLLTRLTSVQPDS